MMGLIFKIQSKSKLFPFTVHHTSKSESNTCYLELGRVIQTNKIDFRRRSLKTSFSRSTAGFQEHGNCPPFNPTTKTINPKGGRVPSSIVWEGR